MRDLAGEHLAAAADQGTLRPVFDETWVDRVTAMLHACPIADEKLSGEIGTPLFTRTHDPGPRGRLRGCRRDGRKAARQSSPDHLHGPDRHHVAYLVTKDTADGAKALIGLGLLALGVGIASSTLRPSTNRLTWTHSEPPLSGEHSTSRTCPRSWLR